eukprot:1508299-Pyramimonas_sp.AAC.1
MTTRAERRATQECQRLMRAAEEVEGLEVKWRQEPDAVEFKAWTEIILIRHGETQWNIEHRLQGQQNCALNEMGIMQAYAVAEHLRESSDDVDATYSSDLSRAKITADIIAKALGQPQVVELSALRERSLGVLEGHTVKEAQEK